MGQTGEDCFQGVGPYQENDLVKQCFQVSPLSLPQHGKPDKKM